MSHGRGMCRKNTDIKDETKRVPLETYDRKALRLWRSPLINVGSRRRKRSLPFMKKLDEKIETRSGYNREIQLGNVIKFTNVTRTYVSQAFPYGTSYLVAYFSSCRLKCFFRSSNFLH